MAGIDSRRRCERLILAGRVLVNGKVACELGSKIDPEVDRIIVNGSLVNLPRHCLYLFHKPRGVLSTLHDTSARLCLSEFVKSLPQRVFAVGRLDKDVAGLLLLTNDGEYANRMLHPRYEVERVYWAIVKGTVNPDTLGRLLLGVPLDDGLARAKRVRLLKNSASSRWLLGIPTEKTTLVEIVVVEGRKHFVKRFLAAAGHPVLKLARVRFGPYALGRLAAGEITQVLDYKKFDLG